MFPQPPKGKVVKAKAWALQRKGVISDSLCRWDACRLTLRVKGTIVNLNLEDRYSLAPDHLSGPGNYKT